MRRVFSGIAFLAVLWALGVRLFGGFTVSLAGLRLSSSDSVRPLIVAAVAAAIYGAISGRARLRADADALRRRLTPARLAALLTAIVLVVGIANNSWSAGGSDSYSYVSQADLWLQGDLKVPVPIAESAPWPNALGTFTPLGYRTVPGANAITPVTGPGLPLLMAAFKRVAGHPAMFLVAPLCGALLVWTTFLIGRRLGSEPRGERGERGDRGDRVGLGGAWLVATSPTFLMIYKSQMSDVPSAAFWALATYGVLGRTLRSAFGAGLAASMAILIRPNLVPLAAVLGAWAVYADLKGPRRTIEGPRRTVESPRRTVDGSHRRTMEGRSGSITETVAARTFQVRMSAAFALGALPGCLIVAAINNSLYGSPLSSGYGDLSALFSLANVPLTLSSYGRWLFETQTPIVAISIVVLAIAPARVWPDAAARAGARLLAGILVTVWAAYALYPAFDAWWFLRFLLPSWPAIFIGTAAGIAWLLDGRVPHGRALTALALLALGGYGLAVTARRDVFSGDEGERRYAEIAKLVEAQTEPSAMILASMHVGSVRYYAGRASMRFDLLDEAWLDRTAAWLQHEGRHPYVLVEDWEMPAFTKRFAGKNLLGDLRMAPALAYRAYRIAGTIYLFDLARRDGPTLEPPPSRDQRPRCLPPAVPPRLTARP